MKHFAVSLALAALLAGPWTRVQAQDTGQPCTIVTDGSPSIFEHELAHCNGWWHPSFQTGYDPPWEFIRKFPGPLTVIIANGSSAFWTRPFAQEGTKFVSSAKSVETLCKWLWQKHHINADMTQLKNGSRLSGCSVKGN